MTGENTCTLCLNVVDDLEPVNDAEKGSIHVVIPQIDISNNPEICKGCIKFIQQSFAFKSKCLEIEDSILDYKYDESRVNLEKILGVINESEEKYIKICRTCLGVLENGVYKELEHEHELRNIMGMCIPELDISLTLEPVICEICEETLKNVFNFISLCIGNQEKIKLSVEKSKNNNQNLYDIIQYKVENDNSLSIKDDIEIVEERLDSSETLSDTEELTIQSILISNNVPNATNKVSVEENARRFDEMLQSMRSKVVSAVVTKKESNVIHVISDSEDELTVMKDKDKSPESDSESSCLYISEEEERPKKSKRAKKKTLNAVKKVKLKKSICCKYCDYTTSSQSMAKAHIYSCRSSPYVQNTLEETFAPVTNLQQIRSIKTYSGKRKGLISNESTTIEKNSQKQYGDILDTFFSKEMANSEDNLKTAVVKLSLKRWITDDPKKNEFDLLIKNNKKKLFSALSVMACNDCSFNTRSVLKMTIHRSNYPSSSGSSAKHAVNYNSGYRTLYYCVHCTKSFETDFDLRVHLESCGPVSSDAFLLRIDKVMHCLKCYFDSDDTQLVLKHLQNCANIKT